MARHQFTAAELADVIAKHKLWLRGDPSGARANLADADLAGADLAGADLADANLARAYLADANLARADLARANLADADLADANLARADLARANLADAYLAGAYLADAKNMPPLPEATEAATDPQTREQWLARRKESLAARAERYRQRHPDVPVVPNLDRAILDAVTVGGGTLDMGVWHKQGCQTTHCRAGWAIHKAGDAGYALEEKYGPRIAGAMIYRASTGRAPHFFASTEDALADIKACAAAEAPATETVK